MKKLRLLRTSMIAAATLLVAGACGNNSGNETNAGDDSDNATEIGGARIGYVEIDSLMAQYQFCIDYTLLMNKKGENIQSTLAAKEKTLEKQAMDLQRKYESNGFTTRDELQRAQMNLAKQQQDYQELGERLMADFNKEQAVYNEEMKDSIQSFLAEYNKDKKFDLIITKAGDNILMANPRYNITKDVVTGLNKRYNIKPEVAKQISIVK